MVGWRMRLDILCADLQAHARLSNLGTTLAHGQLVSALAGRFRAHALWRRHPEIADQPLSAPIIVVGHMRSGSTRMQRLLACDPRLTFTRFYESWNPVPQGRPGGWIDDRKLKAWIGLACAGLLNPAFRHIHPTEWHAPDEEIGLHSMAIYGAAFEAQWNVPNFTAVVENGDGIPVYIEFRRLLQTLRWLRGDRADRPWVLKVPQFTQDLPALLNVFPDARLIYLLRDPARTAASSASLVLNQMTLQSHNVDADWVHREWARKIRLRDMRMAAAKSTAAGPHIEITYDDVDRDWRREMRRVYAMLEMPLDDGAGAAMQRYLQASRSAARPHTDPDRAKGGPSLAVAG